MKRRLAEWIEARDPHYVTAEAVANLRRNLTLALATTLTVAVSLSLVGAAFLIRKGVENATVQWKGGIEFIVYMNPDATSAHVRDVGRALRDDKQIESFRYLDSDAAYDEFQRLFKRDSPRLAETVTADVLPTNFKVSPSNPDTAVVQRLVTRYQDMPDVYRVVAATDTIKTMQRVSDVIASSIMAGAVILVIAAVVLVVNTIRTAMVSRRSEVEVMQLVGASSWFIRVPFVLEGAIQGAVGAAVAIAATVGLNRVFESRLASATGFDLLRNFLVEPGAVRIISVLLAFGGVAIGMAGSALAIRRHLDV